MELDAAPRALFDRLPAEILDLILLQPSLCGEDIKSIRLASKRIESSATRRLFRKVHISALHRDREAFLNIAQSPHLARHVQTLVWDELTGNFRLLQTSFHVEYLGEMMGWGDSLDSVGSNLVDDIISQVQPLFWLTSESAPLEDGEMGYIGALPFWDEFVEAVDKLPALRSFVSRPMQPNREVQSAADGYPLTVRVIKNIFLCEDVYERQDAIFNLGFLFYLIPLLKLYTERGDQRPRQLFFSDEDSVTKSSLEYLATSDAPAFRHLHHLELNVFERARWSRRETSGLEACLTEAVNLRHLHLRYIQAQCRDDFIPGADIDRSPLYAIPTLPSLVSLCLDDVILEHNYSESPDYGIDLPRDHEQPAFVNFITRHAATLKRLCVLSSYVTRDSVCKLARVPDLKLHRFIMANPDTNNTDYTIKEEDILNFINWKYDYDSEGNKLPGQAEGPILSSRFPKCTHVLPALEEYGKDESLTMVDNCREICRTHDAPSGLWVDEDGIYYDPATDQEMTEPRQEYCRPKDWQGQVDKRRWWDGDLGLWRDTSPCHNTPLHKYAIDRVADTTFGDNLDKRGENDPGLQEERNRAMELPAYPPELCLLEEFEHQARKLGRPKWAWGTDDLGHVWYWEVPNNGPGHPTRIWHFTHRNGEEAYGDDPLEFWPDWEGGTSGDTVSATPFGSELRSFAEAARDKRRGDSHPPSTQVGTKYGRPVRYSLLSDPWWAQEHP